jgi:hypothetical protein
LVEVAVFDLTLYYFSASVDYFPSLLLGTAETNWLDVVVFIATPCTFIADSFAFALFYCNEVN